MASLAQIAANQANSRKSTGPRSVEGKSASRFNALKHGIDAHSVVIPGEDPAEYQALADAYQRQYRPESASECFHVATMLRAEWQRMRLDRVETDLTRKLLAENPGQSLADALLSGSPAAKLLIRTQRQIAGFERTWHRADNALLRERRELNRADSVAMAQAMHQYMTAPIELASFPQNPQNPQPAQPAPPAAPQSAKPWPPIDEKTGRPLYFVG